MNQQRGYQEFAGGVPDGGAGSRSLGCRSWEGGEVAALGFFIRGRQE